MIGSTKAHPSMKRLYYRKGINEEDRYGSEWEELPNFEKDLISIDAGFHCVYAVDTDNHVYQIDILPNPTHGQTIYSQTIKASRVKVTRI
jgi:hypothetical protein